uniref:Uncharacterized protein n=1 Tax=Panagrolaimus sp. ES5 TaxID=591445 RepID=A0AC34FWH3_9BILA
CESEEKDEFKKSKSFNNSTHSLHIATYENSAEATADSDGVKNEKAQKKGGENLGLSKKWKTSNDFIDGLKLIIQNQFEFPRQQDTVSGRPEVMQFKASQRLLNPNQMNANNQTPQGSPSVC